MQIDRRFLDGAALRIRTDGDLAATNDFEQNGLIENGSTWESEGYDEAEITIDLSTNANAGSFRLNPEGGCHG